MLLSRYFTRQFSRWLSFSWLLILLTVSPAPADADRNGSELRLGALAHSVGPLSDGTESGLDLNLELLLAQNPLRHTLWGRLFLGTNLNLNGDTSQFYAGRAWRVHLPWAFEVEYQFGGVLHTGELDTDNPERRQLGTRFLMRNAFELGWRWDKYRLSAIYDHTSNGGLYGERNQGLDNIGIRLSVGL